MSESAVQESEAAKETKQDGNDKRMRDKKTSAERCKCFLDSSPDSDVHHGKAAAKWHSPFSSATYLLPPTAVGQCICGRLSTWLQKVGEAIMGY